MTVLQRNHNKKHVSKQYSNCDSGKRKKNQQQQQKRQADLSKKYTAARKAKVIILLFRKSGLGFVWFLSIKVLRLLPTLL